MEMTLIVGLVVGIMAYVAKLYIFHLLIGGFPRIERFINTHALALVIVDFAFGYMGAHILEGYGQIGMIALVTFVFCSMINIITIRFKVKHEDSINSFLSILGHKNESFSKNKFNSSRNNSNSSGSVQSNSIFSFRTNNNSRFATYSNSN